MITIEADYEELRRRLDPGRVAKAEKAAIRRVARRSATLISKVTRRKYTIKARDIARSLKIIPQAGGHSALLRYRGARPGLINFRARELKRVKVRATSSRGRTFQTTRRGVTAQIRKDRPRFVVKGAFMADVNQGNRHVMRRAHKNSARGEIISLKGPSVPHMVQESGTRIDFQAFLAAHYPEELQRQLNYQFNRV